MTLGGGQNARLLPLGRPMWHGAAARPQPLRSDEFSEGLHGLSPKELERVHAANRVYAVCCRLILFATSTTYIGHWSNPQDAYGDRACDSIPCQHRRRYQETWKHFKNSNANAARCTSTFHGVVLHKVVLLDRVEWPLEFCKGWTSLEQRAIMTDGNLELTVMPKQPLASP